MKTDRELLELAAKAAGISNLRGADSTHHCYYLRYDETPVRWNPLTDDGDCARLEATLSLNVSWYPAMVLVGTEISTPASPACAEYFDQHNGDKNAARRRASTRAAADIGASL